MVTIKEVAKRAGVSVATVSRTINNSGYVGEKTRKKVEQAISELGYYPNEVARSLYQKKSKIIGLLLPDIANPYFPLLTKGVEDSAQMNGYMVLLGNVEDDQDKEDNYIQFLTQHNVSGILSSLDGLRNEKVPKSVPYILLDRADEQEEYTIATNDLLGGQLSAQAVIKGKPKNTIVMIGPEHLPGPKRRLEGIKKIFEQEKRAYEVFETHTFQVEEAEAIATQLFERYESFDSVIAQNDVFALAIMKEALKRGIRIPEDLQIIGYDNIPYSKFMYPGLSTIEQPAYHIGYQGAQMLFDLIEGKEIKEKKIELDPYFINRESLRVKE